MLYKGFKSHILFSQQPDFGLLNRYHGFIEELDPRYLGVAGEGYGYLAYLLFYWVDPLMRKGAGGHIRSTDCLFDLPATLLPTHLSALLERALLHGSLLKALHRFGPWIVTISSTKSNRIRIAQSTWGTHNRKVPLRIANTRSISALPIYFAFYLRHGRDNKILGQGYDLRLCTCLIEYLQKYEK